MAGEHEPDMRTTFALMTGRALAPRTLLVAMVWLACRDPRLQETMPLVPYSPVDAGSRAFDAGLPRAPAACDPSMPADGGEALEWNRWESPPVRPVDAAYDLTADTVTDTVTGLMWQRLVSMSPKTTDEAREFCAESRLAGFSDWRVPTLVELESIVDYGSSSAGGLPSRTTPTINTLAFPSTPTELFWSSTPKLASEVETHSWAVTFDTAFTIGMGNTEGLRVRCARQARTTLPQSPCRYAISNDTVRDIRGNITWQRAASPVKLTFAEAQAACAALDLGGFSSGWRVPNIRELRTLVDVRSFITLRLDAPVDAIAFPATPVGGYWSSTPVASGGAWAIDEIGNTGVYLVAHLNHVRCVR